MTALKKIVEIPGNIRKSSVNKILIRHIAQLYLDNLDIKIFEGLPNTPHFNPDLDTEKMGGAGSSNRN